ncbi:MAG: ATP-binding protein [Cyanobacteria bacterium P01_E01_bin.48]
MGATPPSTFTVQQIHPRAPHNQLPIELPNRGIFWEARTKILLVCTLLIALFVGTSIPVFRQIVLRRVDARVRVDLKDDLEFFLETLEGSRQPVSTVDDLTIFIDRFSNSFLPEDDNFLIFLVGGEFVRSDPISRPESRDPSMLPLSEWALTETSIEGTLQSGGEEGDILYLVKPISLEGVNVGTAIAAHTIAGEQDEALDAVSIFIYMSIGTVTVALVLAWIATGQVLRPIQILTRTARTISETDLEKRLPVRGEGEMAELGRTFNGMMARLQTAFEIQRKFIRDMSHELRTPITIVRGHLELMEVDTQEQKETVELCIDELDRMSRFVNDLILLARSEMPNFLDIGAIELGSFTDELFAKAKVFGDRMWVLDALGDVTLAGDRARLTGAMMNLVENAVRHTQTNGEIGIGSSVTKGVVRLWVRDTGSGVPASDRKRIFQRFERGRNTTKSSGSGLGLSIVKAKAEAHGGWVELDSQEGQGSTFTIAIPLSVPIRK